MLTILKTIGMSKRLVENHRLIKDANYWFRGIYQI